MSRRLSRRRRNV
uniref:Uncharacterized protein n=1 Tax=Arundo donax TaxID=35708 RepID=A0A0A9GXZ4_ARUDO